MLLACTPTPHPEVEQELQRLKTQMTETFSGLEVYALEHSQQYPRELSSLVPKYLDRIPQDPRTKRPLIYQRLDSGYQLRAEGDYSDCGADPGYPRMDQDGFFALRASDFPDDSEL